MKKRGITILEVLVVLSIVTLLTALTTPVFKSVIREAKITRSLSNMKQLHQAIIVYMGDSDDLTPGKALPPTMLGVISPMKLPYELYHTGGRSMTDDPGRSDVYMYAPPLPDSEESALSQWNRHVQKTHGNPILIVDQTWSETEGHFNVFVLKFALGIYFDGHISRKNHYGLSGAYETWENKNEN